MSEISEAARVAAGRITDPEENMSEHLACKIIQKALDAEKSALEQTVAQLRKELEEASQSLQTLENGTDADKSTIRVALKAGRGIGRAAALLEKVDQEEWSKIFREHQEEARKENAALERERADLRRQLAASKGLVTRVNNELSKVLHDTAVNDEREYLADELSTVKKQLAEAQQQRDAAVALLEEALGNEKHVGFLYPHNPQWPPFVELEECPADHEYECGNCEFKTRIRAAIDAARSQAKEAK